MSDSRESTPHYLLQAREHPRLLSLVIPMYNEEIVVEPLRAAIDKFSRESGLDLEVLIVNDGSADRTLSKLLAWAHEDCRVIVINLSRNFGHQIAATAGLDHARGDAVVLMDGDLQDPLSVIPQMVDRYCEGYDVVFGQREKREGESLFKRATAWLFYRLMQTLVYRALPVDSGDFRLLSRRCLESLKTMRETHRFLRGMVAWVGFPQCAVRYRRLPRAGGKTKYPLGKMLAFAWTAATSFSTVPLQVTLVLGLLVGLLGAEEAVRAIVESARGQVVPGWTSLMVVTSVIGSAMLIGLGIVGQYIARIYEEAKDRPLYVVAQTYSSRELEGDATSR